MSIWIWVGAGVLAILTIAVAIARAMRPKQFEPVELEYDMRALKQVHAVDADKEAKARDAERLRKLVIYHQAKQERGMKIGRASCRERV